MTTVNDYTSLREHVGHKVTCVCYGRAGEDPYNVAIECEDCGVVLIDYDHPDVEGTVMDGKKMMPIEDGNKEPDEQQK